VAFFLPVFGFLCGLGLASISGTSSLKSIFSSLLARCFIPAVIIYNMVFYQAGSLALMLFSFGVAIIMFYLFRWILKDNLRALCVSYINLAWLGFPFALALFGPKISAAMVALYVGGSVFGNMWAVMAVSSKKLPWTSMIQKVAMSPPVFALMIAGVCRLIGLQHMQEHQLLDVLYQIAKVGMSFTGMCVLGMWLRQTKVQWVDLLNSSRIFAMKLTVGAVICSLTYWLIPIPHIDQYIGVMFMLFCLPPAANIVALETHYQGTGVSARYIASGTIMSCIVVSLYGLILHL
jgi:malate permease and related proteins